jgi:hypothetical protein
MTNVFNNFCRENKNTHFMVHNFSENRNNAEKYGGHRGGARMTSLRDPQALNAELAMLHARSRMHMHARTHARKPIAFQRQL